MDGTNSRSYSYLHKPCELAHLPKVLEDACKKSIMSKMQNQMARRNASLYGAPGDSPLGILRRLKEMEKGAAGRKR